MKTSSFISFCIFSAWAAQSSVTACDLCGCYTPQLEALPQTKADSALGQGLDPFPAQPSPASWHSGIYSAVAEQFTHFGTIQVDGEHAGNPAGQREESSITQLVAGYSFNQRFALQVNVPFLYRSYRRPEGFDIERGHEAGLGDVSLLGKLVLFHVEALRPGERVSGDAKMTARAAGEPDFTASALLIAGVKFPTGDSSRLKEEFHESEVEGAPESGIHGHDLALGTGGYDGIFGGQTSLRYKNAFFEADVQFTLRGDGLHSYHFANDLSWSGGPGWYLVRNPAAVLGLQCVVSGEHKETDRFRGKVAGDTGITSVFFGPRVVASFGRVSGEVGADLPVSIDNTALQIVPDYRIRAALSVRF